MNKQDLGQLLMVGFHGTMPEDPWVQILSRQIQVGLVGGIILYGYNIESPAQVKKLIDYFKSLKAPKPLLIAVDEEGGYVSRLSGEKGFSDFMGPFEVTQNFSAKEAESYYQEMAHKIGDTGFNLNFGPLVDMNPVSGPLCTVIGDLGRSYGSDAASVENYARAFIYGHAQENVVTCLKHFPGHGRVRGDTHTGFVTADASWTVEELIPFQRLAKHAPMIMTAHITHKQWGPLPATFSKELLENVLRKDLGFEGVLITDDLHMGAVQEKLKPSDAARLALQAGNDIILFSNNKSAAKNIDSFAPFPEEIERVLTFLESSIKQGGLNSTKIQRSLNRVERLKDQLN